jgi:hypothetical protein
MSELTKKNFIEWLHTKKDGEIVGEACVTDSCPIANFYKENKKNVDVRVDVAEVAYVKKYGNKLWKKTLPKWAQKFINIIDHDEYMDYVTVETALEVMNEV